MPRPATRPQSPLRVRVLASAALATILGTAGIATSMAMEVDQQRLRVAVLGDLHRLHLSVGRYLADNGDFPTSASDFGVGYRGALVERSYAPPGHQASWAGPYLTEPLSKPSPHAFWHLPAPRFLSDGDGDGDRDEQWCRLHRGYGEIDDGAAQWFDARLDDGNAEAGSVRVTSTWIWFLLAER